MTAPRAARWRVNAFLAVWLPVLALDAFRPACGAHQAVHDAINPALLWTGLWQGPWRLYAPDVGKDNLRLRAEVVFAVILTRLTTQVTFGVTADYLAGAPGFPIPPERVELFAVNVGAGVVAARGDARPEAARDVRHRRHDDRRVELLHQESKADDQRDQPVAEIEQQAGPAHIVLGPGAEQAADWKRIARREGVQLLGPNSLGLQRPRLGLNASVAGPMATPGPLALVSQSGALTSSMLDWAARNAVGFSQVASLGPGSPVDIAEVLDLSIEEATLGCVRTLRGRFTHACQACQGQGHRVLTSACPGCQGKGTRAKAALFGWLRTQETCPDCAGEGREHQHCTPCEGTGQRSLSYRKHVRIPPGVRAGDDALHPHRRDLPLRRHRHPARRMGLERHARERLGVVRRNHHPRRRQRRHRRRRLARRGEGQPRRTAEARSHSMYSTV